MPTPFMHIAFAHRFIQEPAVPLPIRATLREHWGPFLLGSIAADARVSSGLQRADTHFFDYQAQLVPPPHQVMLATHPTLRASAVQSASQRAFIAGYAGHLAMDEIWCTAALYPLFSDTWGTSRERFMLLHMLLGVLDARDYHALEVTDQAALQAATPHHWLPFMPDADLVIWRDLIAGQMPPVGASQTNDILSKRIGISAADMTAFINDSAQMEQQLWANVPHEQVEQVEVAMHEWASKVILDYYADYDADKV